MEGNIYYVVLGAFLLMALLSIKHDKWMFAFIFVALAGWVYYTHETGVTYADIKQDIGEAVDESAKKKYKEEIKHDFSEVPISSSASNKKEYETDPRYKVGE